MSFHPGASLMSKLNAVLKQNQQTIQCLQLEVIESFHLGANLMAKLNVALKQNKGYNTYLLLCSCQAKDAVTKHSVHV